MKTFTTAAPRPRPLALALALGLGIALSPPLAAQQASAAQPWMDTALSPGPRAALVLTQMTDDGKFQMLRSYFGLGTDKIPKPEGALGSGGDVPGIARLGIPAAGPGR
ncbi:glycosyl hydrolase, partial [Xanthomonas campestris]